MNESHLVLHGLAIKKHAGADDVARLVGLEPARVEGLLEQLAESGRAVSADSRYMVSPLAKVALETAYSRHFADVRKNSQFMEAYEAFERINIQLKELITDWQSIEVGGRHVTNDHSDKDYDARVIDRLGNLHEQAEKIFLRLEAVVPRLAFYRENLLAALERAEDGDIEWISDARIESYHTLWFELHEDLLRIVGGTRVE